MSEPPSMNRGLLLVLDTATRQPVLALADADGRVLGARQWTSRHRHGEELLPQLDSLLGELGATPRDISGLAVGTGPGSFTGLRIGLATAKVLAYSLEVPIVGVPTTQGLAMAAAEETGMPSEIAVTLPAGASDRYLARFGVTDGRADETAPAILVADETSLRQGAEGAVLVAVDMDDGLPEETIARGRTALARLATSLAREGARRLATGDHDDVAALVPAYVALPRGVRQAAEEIRWSPDLR